MEPVTTHMWRSENNPWELINFFYHAGLGLKLGQSGLARKKKSLHDEPSTSLSMIFKSASVCFSVDAFCDLQFSPSLIPLLPAGQTKCCSSCLLVKVSKEAKQDTQETTTLAVPQGRALYLTGIYLALSPKLHNPLSTRSRASVALSWHYVNFS